MTALPQRFRILRVIATLLSAGCITAAHADTALVYQFGTFGFGLDAAHQLTRDVTVRAGYHFFVHGQDTDSNGVRFDAASKINSASLLFDWHFNHSPWRITVGLAQSGLRAEANGTATGTVTFNGQTYSPDQLGSLRAVIKPAHAIAPYAGIGFGHTVGSADKFTLLLDLGAMNIGAPRASINATCGDSAVASQCNQLLSDIQAEVSKRERQWRDIRWWPVAAFGFSMRW